MECLYDTILEECSARAVILELCIAFLHYSLYDVAMDIKFSWDEKKERENIKKHGISFEVASLVFADERRIEFFDTEHSIDEDRYITIGMVGDVLMVVYTIREDQHRIISARIANKRERSKYNGY